MSGSPFTGPLVVTLLFGLVFLRGSRFHLLGGLQPRTIVSLAGGAAIAYVFIDMSPELQRTAAAFREATEPFASRILDYGIHLATLAGFLLAYGVEELVIRSKSDEERRQRREAGHVHDLFRLHMIAFGAYAWIVTYLLVHALDRVGVSLWLYAVAMALHFLSVAHSLHQEHGRLYESSGRWVLAACCIAGWVSGLALALPEPVVGLLFGLVAGGIIANTVISELPRERDGRFGPFLLGAAIYATLLLIVG